ncbi:hypothetical protein [Selenomonas ruminantium]|uniref:Uncharacterized protein n=1 Tax=Selenomonas ruminantium TaxID=971 RepID=A0A1I0Y4A9_SELRU|nr:hypothetical protein [Selenomonas ruminantium]SFB08111.1 hypothetical protein SAMN05216587_1106 [Selenomonas ruminantium]
MSGKKHTLYNGYKHGIGQGIYKVLRSHRGSEMDYTAKLGYFRTSYKGGCVFLTNRATFSCSGWGMADRAYRRHFQNSQKR